MPKRPLLTLKRKSALTQQIAEALDQNKRIAGVQDAAVVPAIPEKRNSADADRANVDKTVVRAEALKKRLSTPAEAQEDVSAEFEQGTKASNEPQKGVPSGGDRADSNAVMKPD